MKTAKVYMNRRSQLVRLQKEFRFDGSEVLIRTRVKEFGRVPRLLVEGWGE